jgi:hypothetical protein
MSSARRSANEINILAMLDRHEAGGLPRRLLRGLRGRSAMFWYGGAGVLVLGLLGTLGWLARDSGAPPPADAALAGAVTPAAGQASGSVVRAAPPAAVSLPRLEAAPAAASEAAAAGGLEATRASAPAAGATIVEVAPAPLPEADAPVPRDAQRETQAAIRQATQRLATHTPAAKPAARTASSRPALAGARPAAIAHADPRARRPPTSAKPAPAAVDTDVALISAIIQHANKRQENEEAARKP